MTTLTRWTRARLAFGCVMVLVLLSTQARAQLVGRGPPPPWPPPNIVTGGPGPDVSVGTPGGDSVWDFAPGGDNDVLVDGPGGADGTPDLLSSLDGDDLDLLIGGPEDVIQGNDGDTVLILSPVNNTVILFQGTVVEYRRARAILRWVQDQLQALVAALQALLPNASLDWSDALQDVSAQLASIDPGTDDGSLIAFAAVFDIGPYQLAPTPWSPLGLVDWYPFDAAEDPVQATASLTMTREEYDLAVLQVQGLLHYVLGFCPAP